MDISINITQTVANALSCIQVGGYVQLYHGTSFEGASSIDQYGLDAEKAFAGGGEGYFWCTPYAQRAAFFAHATMSNKPMIVDLSLPITTIHELLVRNPVGMHLIKIDDKPTLDFRFHWNSFSILNEQMFNVNTTLVIKETFTEK